MLIEVKDLYKKYNENEQILNGVSLAIEENTFVTIVGPSGSGKSTLLSIISGLQMPSKGSVIINGENIVDFSKDQLAHLRATKIGYVFQEYNLMQNLTAEENIFMGKTNKDCMDINEIVRILNIEHLLSKYPYEMSGGEQQRVAIARALIKKPKILFCDEATGALDEKNSKNVIALLLEVKKRFGMTIVFITHNLEIPKVSERMITMKDGQIFNDCINHNPINVEQMNWS